MPKSLEIIVLGCGNSSGVPAIGNFWGQCDPKEPKNTRFRSSILIKSTQSTLIIDTGPDFREQLNRENINNIDAVLYTHPHNDHVMGIDELRVLKYRNQKEFIPIYGNEDTIHDLEKRFDYLFHGGNHALYPPIIKPHILDKSRYGSTHSIDDVNFIPFEQDHGTCTSIGYRFGNFAYSVDILNLNQTAIQILQGIDTWLVDCAAYKDNNNAVHAGLEKIIMLNDQIGAKNVYLTSLSLSMDYQTLVKELPENFKPAHDGLRLQANL